MAANSRDDLSMEALFAEEGGDDEGRPEAEGWSDDADETGHGDAAPTKQELVPEPKRRRLLDTQICDICKKSSEDCEWYMKVPVLRNGVLVLVPNGSACLDDGIIASTFPLLNWQHVVEYYFSRKDFRVEFDTTKLVKLGSAPRTFIPAQVGGRTESGYTMKSLHAVITDDEFLTIAKVSARAVGLETSECFLSDEGRTAVCLIVSLVGLPDKYRYRVIEFFTTVSNFMDEFTLLQGSQYRPGQAKDLLTLLKNTTVNGRPASLRDTAQVGRLVYKWPQVEEMVDKYVVPLEVAEAAALETAGGVQPLTHYVPGVQLPSAVAAAVPEWAPILERAARAERQLALSSPAPQQKRQPCAPAAAAATAPACTAKASGVSQRFSRGSLSKGSRGNASSSAGVPQVRATSSAASGPADRSSRCSQGLRYSADANGEQSKEEGGSALALVVNVTGIESSYPSISILKILGGECLGRSVTGAKRLLKGIPEAETVRRQQLDTLITLAELAESVQPQRVAKLSVPEIKDCSRRLAEHGFELSKNSCRIVTVTTGKSMLQSNRNTKWAANFSFDFAMGLEWDIDDPLLPLLPPEFGSSEDIEVYVSTLYKLYFSDPMLEAMMMVTSEGGPSNVRLMEVAKAALTVPNQELPRGSKYPETIEEAKHDLQAMTRGLLALLSPVPGIMGASSSDVDFLCIVGPAAAAGVKSRRFKDRSLSNLVGSGPQACRDYLRSSTPWKTLLSHFKNHAANEITKGPMLQNLGDKLADLKLKLAADPASEEVLAAKSRCLEDFFHQLPDLLPPALRAGATFELEGEVINILRKDFVAIVQPGGETTQVQKLGALKLLVSRLTVPSREQLMSDVAQNLKDAEVEDRTRHLDDALDSSFGSMHDVAALRLALAASKTTAVSMDVASTMVDVRALIWKLLATTVVDPGAEVSDVTIADAVDAISLLSKRQEVVAAAGGADKDKANAEGLVGIAISLAKLRSAIQRLRSAELARDTSLIVNSTMELVGCSARFLSTTTKWLPQVTEAASTWSKHIVENSVPFKDAAVLLVSTHAAVVLEMHMTSLKASTEQLMAIAGGDPMSSNVWHEGLDNDASLPAILAHAKLTVCKVAGKVVSSARQKVEKEMGAFKADRARLATVIESVKKHGDAECKRAGDAVTRAFVSKYEGLVLDKWNTDPDNRVKRLQELTKTVTKDAKPFCSNVSDIVFAPLWKVIANEVGS